MAGSGSRRANRIGRRDKERLYSRHFAVVMFSDCRNYPCVLSVTLHEVGTDLGMGAIDFVCQGLSDIVQEPGSLCDLLVGTDLRGENSGNESDFNGVLQHVFTVAVAELQPPYQLY